MTHGKPFQGCNAAIELHTSAAGRCKHQGKQGWRASEQQAAVSFRCRLQGKSVYSSRGGSKFKQRCTSIVSPNRVLIAIYLSYVPLGLGYTLCCMLTTFFFRLLVCERSYSGVIASAFVVISPWRKPCMPLSCWARTLSQLQASAATPVAGRCLLKHLMQISLEWGRCPVVDCAGPCAGPVEVETQAVDHTTQFWVAVSPLNH